MKAEIKTTIKLIPHPEPSRLVDVWARIVVNEILRREAEPETQESLKLSQLSLEKEGLDVEQAPVCQPAGSPGFGQMAFGPGYRR